MDIRMFRHFELRSHFKYNLFCNSCNANCSLCETSKSKRSIKKTLPLPRDQPIVNKQGKRFHSNYCNYICSNISH